VSDGEATDEQLEACECADLGCIQMIEMTLAEYEDLRKESNRFAVLPGHVLPDVERVVSENDRFVVVAKLGDGERVAEELDPRE